jgi:uncharacterized membrane protein
VLWANMHLLFWLSLVPFATAWLGENNFAPAPTAVYGFSLLMPAIAWYIMQRAIFSHQGADSPLRRVLGSDLKGNLSPLLYLSGMGIAFVQPLVSELIYWGVALMWLVPDRRIESHVTHR